MTYRCGISPELAVQCRVKLYVQRPNGLPYAWFMNRKNAPGWAMVWRDDGSSSHFCPRCKPVVAVKRADEGKGRT